MSYRALRAVVTRVSLLCLVLLAASSLGWASNRPLADVELNQVLRQLEQEELPLAAFRQRVAALAAQRAVYPPHIRGRIGSLQCWAMKAERDSDYRAAIAFAEREIAQARLREDLATEIDLQTCRADRLHLLGKMDEAKQGFDQAFLQVRQLGDRRLEAQLLRYRGDMLAYQGAMAEGVIDLIESHRIYDELEWEEKRLRVFMLVANTYRRMGSYDRAEGYFRELVDEYRARGDHEKLNEAYLRQSLLYGDMGDYPRALPLMAEAERYFAAQHQVMDLAWSQIESANILVHLGRTREAAQKLQLARPALFDQASTDQPTVGQWWLTMGLVLAAENQPVPALDALNKAEPIFVREQNPRFLAPLYQMRANILERQGETAAALQSLKQYVSTKLAMDTRQWQQRSLQLRLEFDLARKEQENQQLKQLGELRYWQALVAGLLVLLLLALALYLLARARKLQALSSTDELTGIDNRRRIQAQGLKWFAQSKEEDKPFAVLMLDIDHFKLVNDQLGHQAGDQVLIAVARCIAGQLRSLDLVGRNGGEEFLVLLPETTLSEAGLVAERIRQQVSLLTLDCLPAGRVIHISIGCAQRQPQDEHLSDLIQRADQAMYCAKQAGRNQVGKAS